MPRQQTRKQFLNFVGGLNTESSPLSFPENTAKDLDNVDLLRDGSIKRRRGLEFELGGNYSVGSITETDLDSWAISAHEWESVDGDDTLNFAVIQIGCILYFHNLGEESLSGGIIGSISLDPIKTRTDHETYTISTTVGQGKLFVVSPAISPAYIQYNADTGVFSGVKLTLKIRDTDGLDEQTDSPVIFGDSQTPDPGTDPVEDTNDTIDPVTDVFDFSDFTDLGIGGGY